MEESVGTIAGLTAKNTVTACAAAKKIVAESHESNRWYCYIGDFTELLRHENSLVRNRAIAIIAANARWDKDGRYEALIDEFLTHVEDDKPITVRQCIKALPEIAAAKPGLAFKIKKALEQADLSEYNDSMRPLILKDISNVLKQIS